MGNSALRRELKTLMKENHQFSTKGLLRGLNARELRRHIASAKVVPGDWIHDCTGFNYQVKEVKILKHGQIFCDIDFLFVDGGFRCTCGDVQPAKTKEEINQYFKNFVPDPNYRYTVILHELAHTQEGVCNDLGECLYPPGSIIDL